MMETKVKEGNNCLITMGANERLKSGIETPRRKMLFSEFWYEGETCVLFAFTGNGKSVLATQIANSIASGTPIEGFDIKIPAQKVLYCDFETDASLFAERYSGEYKDPFVFSDNLRIAELDYTADAIDGVSDEDQIILSVKKELNIWPAKVLIIDNITAIANDMLKANDVKKLTNKLKALKAEYGLSMLVLAHTTKRYDDSKPITISDMFGSSLLGNFCDSAFAIGKSVFDENIRYIIQQKQRRVEKKYGKNNVIACRLEKPTNQVKFTYVTTGKESAYLTKPTDDFRAKCSEAGRKAANNMTPEERLIRSQKATNARYGKTLLEN
jgi:KaiC/GvpD/RAD55 family RecA-like ATPase